MIVEKTLREVIKEIVDALEEKGYDVDKVVIVEDQVTIHFVAPQDITGELSFNSKALGIT